MTNFNNCRDDLGNIYNSQGEAAKALGVKQSTIHKTLYGEIKTCKGRTLTKISGGIKPDSEIKVKIYQKIGRKTPEFPIKDNLGNIYINATDAAKKLNLKKRQIFRLLSKECKQTYSGISLERLEKK